MISSLVEVTNNNFFLVFSDAMKNKFNVLRESYTAKSILEILLSQTGSITTLIEAPT